jgi:hypothetical protein
MKQTAVEWLMKHLTEISRLSEISLLFNQAKAMEKEQIIDAANWGTLYSDSNKSAEQYYNEKFIK